MNISRRTLLKSTTAAGVIGLGQHLFPSWMPKMALAQGDRSNRDVMVVIFQRGGMDGLNVIVPCGEGSGYYDKRPTIGIPEPDGGDSSAIDLNGFFGLHPALRPLKDIYDANALNQGDLQETLHCLHEALDGIASTDQDDLKAILIGQIALLQTALADNDAAVDSFTQAVSAQAARGDTIQVEAALHNLFSVAQMANQQPLADTTLQQLNDLRSMFDDEAGTKLTAANWGRVSGEAWRFDEPLSFFQEHNLPQGDIIQSWINQS